MIKKVLNVRQEVIFEHQEAGRWYRRLVGGLGWPWAGKPGWLAVVAEEVLPDPQLGLRKFYLLAEQEAEDIAGLHLGCRELRRDCCCEVWQADLHQEAPRQLFRRENDRLTQKVRVQLQPAPYSGAGGLLALWQMFKAVLHSDRKRLFLGERQQISAQLEAMTDEDVRRPVPEFPAAAALGFAVARLLLSEPAVQLSNRDQVRKTWDPYNMAKV